MITSKTNDAAINPYFVLILALTAGTFAGVLIKLTQDAGMPPLTVAAGRMLLAAIILTPLVLTRHLNDLKAFSLRDWLTAAFVGFWMAMHFILLMESVARTSLMIVLVGTNTSPIWVALLETTVLKAQLRRSVWIGLFVVVFGSTFIALTSSGANATEGIIVGGAYAVGAAIANGIFLVTARDIRQKVLLIPYIWIVFGFGAIVASTAVLLTGTQFLDLPRMSYFWLLMLTLIPQLIAHTGFNYAVAYIPATVVSISGQVLTVTGSFAAFMVFGEVPTWLEVVGSVIIISGVLYTILAPKRKP